jgi:hypothetical protein
VQALALGTLVLLEQVDGLSACNFELNNDRGSGPGLESCSGAIT